MDHTNSLAHIINEKREAFRVDIRKSRLEDLF
jgi:hypothetical protein